MAEPPSKRRKMRPNNAIAVEKAAKTETINKEKLAQEKLAQEKLEQEKLALEKVNEKKSNQEEQPIAKENKKDKKNKEKKDKSKKVKKDKSKKEKKGKSKKEKSETTASERKNKEKEPPITKKSKLDEKKDDSSEQPIIPKLSTPVPTPYTSASDSDETDDEKRPAFQKSAPAPVKRSVISKPALPASQLSASDSDETDNEQRKPTPKKTTPKPATVKKTTNPTSAPLSDSDSDETDNETRKPAQKKPKKLQQKQQQRLSASDSDDTDAEIRNKSLTKVATVGESSDSDSDSDSDSGIKHNSIKFSLSKSQKGNLESNRISFRGKRAYDEKLSAAENVKDRLSDLFVPEVKDDYFISDSESETDSGEDYDSRDYPSWQRTLSIHHNQENDPWPKQRAFGYSDKLKLEKRIKKICRRDGISFSQAQEIFSSNQRGQYIRFFQKIAKAFPDMSLHKLAKTCKDMYHKNKNTGPWTEDEVKNLKELMKIYGSNIQLLSEHMDRSPANISGYLMNHTGTDKKLLNKRWIKQEDELLAKEAVKYKDGDKISFIAMEPLFKGTRSQKQIATRYYTLRHLIQPDGTIQKPRKATPYEELKYLSKLLEQVRENRLVEESQLNYSKDIGFVDKKFYLKKRAMIKGFEKMSIKDILKKLIEKQKQIIQSLREERLLGSDPDADSH